MSIIYQDKENVVYQTQFGTIRSQKKVPFKYQAIGGAIILILTYVYWGDESQDTNQPTQTVATQQVNQ